MAAKSKLKRGFKSKSEKLALEFREKLGVHPCSPLCAFQLAEHIGIKVYPATEFFSNSSAEVGLLSGNNGKVCEWSALTMTTEVCNRIIIHNPFNSTARQQSDIMHELSHIICEHEGRQIDIGITIPIGMREFNEEQEEEAKCLGSILQIARPGLFWAKKRDMNVEDIASHFNASVDMVKYRLNTSGIEKQLRYLNN